MNKKKDNISNEKVKNNKDFKIQSSTLKKVLSSVYFNSLVISIVSIALTILMTFMLKGEIDGMIALRGCVAGIFISILLIVLYISVVTTSENNTFLTRDLLLIFFVTFAIFLICTLFEKYINLFALPIIAAGVNIAILIKRKIGMLVSMLLGLAMIILNIAVGLPTDKIIDVIFASIISIISAFSMIFITRKHATRFRLLWGTLLYSVFMIPVTLLLGLLITNDWSELVRNAIYIFVGNVLGIAIFTASMPIEESIFGVWTNYKLSEYSSFDQPLLRALAEKAPGTFQHSLSIGNMAELCALAIGENPYRARLAGYYHDIGKIKNPTFFIENQIDGFNPHNELIPELSVKMITRHARDGYELLKEASMPEEIARVALEHHGTSRTQYFFKKAQSITEGDLDAAPYSYPGPIPTNKLSVIVMLCDIVEATIRSKNMTKDEIRQYIKDLIQNKILEGQFDNCEITLKELDIVGKTIEKAIPSMHHSRIDYTKKIRL